MCGVGMRGSTQEKSPEITLLAVWEWNKKDKLNTQQGNKKSWGKANEWRTIQD